MFAIVPSGGHTVIEETTVGGIEDSVRVYLRQMGAVPLLTPAREVELARRMEQAREQVILAVLGTDTGRRGLQELAIALDEEGDRRRLRRRSHRP